MTRDFLEFTRKARQNFIRRDARITAKTCFPLDELRLLTVAASEKGEGRVWRCRYCAGLLTLHMIRYDHLTALKLGGPTTLSNLAICCHRCNTMKGQLDENAFRRLRGFLESLPTEMRKDVESRLCAGPQWRGKGGKAKRDIAREIYDQARARQAQRKTGG